jgi:hypothetical protein
MPTKSAGSKKAVVTKSTEEKTSTTNSKQAAANKPSASAPPVASATKTAAKNKHSPRTPVPPPVLQDLDSPYTSPARVIPVLGAAYGIGRRHFRALGSVQCR